MCQLFTKANQDCWKNITRSLRIDGVTTSIRLEHFFWRILEEIAFRDNLSVGQLITRLYHESLDADHDIGNFTSFLRVCCGRYLSLAADGEITRDALSPLVEENAERLLEREKVALEKRKVRLIKGNNPH